MIFVTKFRANDLNPSKGRQIEFNTNVARDFFGFTKPSYNVIFDCCSVLSPSSVKRVKVALSLSPARGDYKIYQNADSSIDLKDYFLDELKLTTAANLDDYYAIKKITDYKYLLTYIPKGAEFEKFYKNASENLYFIDETNSEDSTEDEAIEIIRKEYLALLLKNYNLVLTGAPGTGKTFLAKQLAAIMVGNCKWSDLSEDQKKQISFVQFHPSYDYTDFVEGLRPDGKGDFIRTDGAFKEFCKRAITDAGESTENAPNAKYVFIIDEINRGELSKIFGELFFSIDPGYRGEDGTVQTQYQNLVPASDVFAKGFYVPKNVYIIGTMNDIDRGVEAMDFAIRRRFAWTEITAEDSATSMGITGPAKEKMDALNKALLDRDLSTAFFIGGAYFRKVEGDDFDGLWKYHLKGIVSEYFRGDPEADESIEYVYNAYTNAGTAAPAPAEPQREETEEAD